MRINWLIIALTLHMFTELPAQKLLKSERNADIVEYTNRDGLPSTNISTIVQTRDGYIWLSGIEGTYRFDGYEFEEVGAEYGVPQMQNLYYDSTQNLLYFASPSRFIIFDGQSYRVFGENEGYKINGPAGQVISLLTADGQGRIWIGSETYFVDKAFNGGLTMFEGGEFTCYDSTSFPLHNVRNFIETPYGDLIFTSSGKNTQSGEEAYIALFKGGKFTRIDESRGVNLQNVSVTDRELLTTIDEKGNTWIPFLGNIAISSKANIPEKTGVLMYDGRDFHQYPGLSDYLQPGQRIVSVAYSKEEDKIYATTFMMQGELFGKNNKTIFELKENRWIPSDFFRNTESLINLKTGQPLRGLKYIMTFFTKKNRYFPETMLLGTTDPNMAQSTKFPNQFFKFKNDHYIKYEAFNGLPMREMNEGMILRTTNGIAIYYPNQSEMLTKEQGVLDPDSFIPVLYSDKNGLVWISYSFTGDAAYFLLSDVGINVWDGEKLRTVTEEDGLYSNTTFNILHDRRNRIWIPTARGLNLCQAIQNSKKDWIFKINKIAADKPGFYNITDMLETTAGEIYCWQNMVRPDYGKFNDSEFFLGHYDGEKIVSLPAPFGNKEMNKKYQNYGLLENNDGKLWLIGHFSDDLQGLSSAPSRIMEFDGQNWQEVEHSPKEQLHYVGRLNNGLYFLTVDGFYKYNDKSFVNLIDSVNANADFRYYRGASVVGTFTNIQSGQRLYTRLRNRGLLIFDGEHLQFFNKKSGLPSTNLYNPNPDLRGNLTFSHPSGALVVRGDRFQAYYDDENIVTGGANVAALDMHNNLVMYYKGVGIYINRQQHHKYPLKITSVSVNNKKYHYHFPEQLSYDRNSLLFSYAALNFYMPQQTTYEHFLEGYDKEWSRAGDLNFTEYQNLPPGNYNFHVRGRTANDIATNQISYHFNISPPFWRTWWAYTVYVLLFTLIIMSIRSIEKRRLRRQQAANLEKERTAARIKEVELKAKAAEAENKVLEIENERKSRELEEARQLQLSMLPQEVPRLPNLEIAVYMKTATEVGGDYYDFSMMEDGSVNVGIGDATGHGMKAGTLVSAMKALFTAESIKMDIKSFFTSANTALKTMKMERVMMGFAMLNVKGHTIRMVNAGMPPAYLYRREHGSVEEIELHAAPLGALKESRFPLKEIDVKQGDTLLLLSDGMPELSNDLDDLFGYDRIRDSFAESADRHPKEIVEYLQQRGTSWINNRDPQDDITFVVVKMK